MKNISRFCLLIIVLMLGASAMGQAPQRFGFQAVARDASGRLMNSQPVGLRVSILQGTPTGTMVYAETHTVTTNSNGLFSVNVGEGSVFAGTFSAINWANGPYYIKSEIDVTGGTNYTLVSTQQMISVPYALHAFQAERLTTPIVESQILSIRHDTIFLTGGSFVKIPAGFSGSYNDLTNKPTIPTVPTNVSAFVNDAGYITSAAVPAVPTNVSAFTNDAGYLTSFTESQVLSIGHDTVYLTGGSFVVLPAGFSGNYNDLTNKPTIPTTTGELTNDAGFITSADVPTVPTNVSAFTNDAGYLTSFTESQVLSIGHDTVYLTGGSFVVLPAGFSGNYNDLTNKPTIPTTTGELTNDAGFITSADVPTVPTNVSAFTNDAGYLTSFTESQVLSIGHDTVYLTGGSFVVLPAGFSGNYNDLTNKPTIPTTTGELTNDAGFITSADVPTIVSAFTNDAGYLTSFTESQVLSIGHDTVYLTGGSFVVLPAGFSGNYNDLTNKPTIPTTTGELTNDAGFITSADVPSVPTNVSAFTNDAGYLTSFTESQVLSIGHDTVYLTGGSFVVLPAGFSGNYNDLTNKPTIPTVPSNVSSFTNDAGYLTSYSETQSLADVVANGSSAGHSQIKNVNDPTEAKDAVNLQYLMAQLARMQHQIDSLGAVVASLGSGGEAPSATITNGALPGAFSVSSTKTVKFSQGNLQYQASTDTWRFAENQYDIIGSANSNISSTYTGWIDLFGWGTSGYHDPSDSYNTRYQPYSTENSTVNSTYNYYGYGPSTNQPSPNLTGTSANYDWGVYNPISNGGNQTGQWRTLTKDEWDYLFNARSASTVNGTANARYCKATVNGVSGIILFPDSYTHPAGVVQPVSINTSSASFTSNTYVTSHWTSMQSAGAVFLPASGFRDGTSVRYVGTLGNYLSASYDDIHRAYGVSFSDSEFRTTNNYPRSYGQSVRLVQDSSVSLTITTCDHYLWHGNDYTTSGDYSYGSELLHLAISHSTHNSETQTASSSYSWHGTDYSSTGTYTYDYTNDEGCPSTDTLHLSIISVPSVSTSAVSNITNNTAVCGGNVTATGGAPVTARGVCWSTSQNPTISNSHTTNGIGTGSFTSSLTGLTAGTTYYVRAYATNSAGTSYGSQTSFTTTVVVNPSYRDITVNGTTFRMIRVEGGTFNMGAQFANSSGANYDEDAYGGEIPVHSVTLSSYYIGQTEVSQGLWDAVMGVGSSSHIPWTSTRGLGSSYPAYYISYNDVQDFIAQLNVQTGLTFRMPTEAEWEYAARGGNQSHGYKYSGSNTIDDVAWYDGISSSKTHPVASKQANELGLYDMSGNVDEWCQDWYGSYSNSSQTNPTGAASGSVRVYRGGSWYYDARSCRSSNRGYFRADDCSGYLGLRLALPDIVPAVAPTITTASVSSITSTTASCGGNVTATGGAPVTARGVCWSTSQNPTISNGHTTNGTGTGSFTSSLTGLTAGTTYYVRSYATNSAGTAYGSQVSFTTTSESAIANGALPGSFSVSSTKTVKFSQGNLQYQASTNTWRFAEDQYDIIGSANTNISSTYTGWIDLFGWGTSGWNSGANSYQPYSTSTSYSYYRPGGAYANNLTGSYANADWGVYNSISNGGNQAGRWRTLTKDEWVYLFETRSTSTVNGTTNARFCKAKVNGVCGIVLFPNSYTHPAGVTQPTRINIYGASFTSNTYTVFQWTSMQAAGAVFLPAAGHRLGTNVYDVGTVGYQWSATSKNSDDAYCVYFTDSQLRTMTNGGRGAGLPVRLVQDQD